MAKAKKKTAPSAFDEWFDSCPPRGRGGVRCAICSDEALKDCAARFKAKNAEGGHKVAVRQLHNYFRDQFGYTYSLGTVLNHLREHA